MYGFFSNWIFWHNIIVSKFIHTMAYVIMPFFLSSNNITFMYILHFVKSTHQLIGICIISMSWL